MPFGSHYSWVESNCALVWKFVIGQIQDLHVTRAEACANQEGGQYDSRKNAGFLRTLAAADLAAALLNSFRFIALSLHKCAILCHAHMLRASSYVLSAGLN